MPRQQSNANTLQPSAAKKTRGPRPKPLSERPFKLRPPIKHAIQHRHKNRKLDVILFLIHHRVYDPLYALDKKRKRVGMEEYLVPNERPDYRPITNKEAEEWWKVPSSTISAWWAKRTVILKGAGIAEIKSQPPAEALISPEGPMTTLEEVIAASSSVLFHHHRPAVALPMPAMSPGGAPPVGLASMTSPGDAAQAGSSETPPTDAEQAESSASPDATPAA